MNPNDLNLATTTFKIVKLRFPFYGEPCKSLDAGKWVSKQSLETNSS